MTIALWMQTAVREASFARRTTVIALSLLFFAAVLAYAVTRLWPLWTRRTKN